ncbi:hypothetical protein M8J76_015948 [Diaphorina citri]|nr:hypothetical protein M8J76_015948 [Diaphorina citri]
MDDRQIVRLNNLNHCTITPPSSSNTSEDTSTRPPTTICIKCKNKVDAFLAWKETAWTVQSHFKIKTELMDEESHHNIHYNRHIRHQLSGVKSEKLPPGHRSSNDSCIDEDYDSAASCSSAPGTPRSSSPSATRRPLSRQEDEYSQDSRLSRDEGSRARQHDECSQGSASAARRSLSRQDESSQDSRLSPEEGSRARLLEEIMEPVVKIEEESVDMSVPSCEVIYGGRGGGSVPSCEGMDYGDPDSTQQLVIDEDGPDENRLHREEQMRIQHFLNRGGANSILRSLISSELPIVRPLGSSESAVLTNRTNLPISPALPPFKLEDDKCLVVTTHENGTKTASYRRKQKHPLRNGHEIAAEETCALRSSSSSPSISSHHTSTVIITPTTHPDHTHTVPSQPSSPSPKKARRSMYPFNYLLEAIDFTSRQSSPDNTSDLVGTSSGSEEREVPQSSTQSYRNSLNRQEDNQHSSSNQLSETQLQQHHQAVLEDLRRDDRHRQDRQSNEQQQRHQESQGEHGSRTQDSVEHNNHDYTAQQPQGRQQVFSIKLNPNLLSPTSNHIPTTLTNGYFTGGDLKAAHEISLKTLLSSNQSAPAPPTILKKARGRSTVLSNGSRESPRPSPSPSPSPVCMSPTPPSLVPISYNGVEESARASPKFRINSTVLPVGQIIPKRADLTCTNCNTKVTTIWRRYPSGEMVCNACGLYYRLHCRPRPVSMRRDNIHPRKRRPKNAKQHSHHHSHHHHDSGDNKSLSSGDESSSISLHSFISASLHHAPFNVGAPGGNSPPSHYALNLSPLCEDNLPLNLAAGPPAGELAR